LPAVVAAAGVGALASSSPARADTLVPLVQGFNTIDTDTWFELDDGDFIIQPGHLPMADGGYIKFHLGEPGTPQMQIFGGSFQFPDQNNGAVEATTYGDGVGVDVTSESGPVLTGRNSDDTSKTDSAAITNVGLGRGLLVSSTNTENEVGASTGVNHGSGAGVWGTSSSGDGVVGVSTHARGGRFRGPAAAIHLTPSTRSTHPTSGLVGDVFVDASARLWFCRKSATATAHAVWAQVV